jgi:transmembrane sensor
MIDETEWRRLTRYLAGECAPDEAGEMQRRIDGDPELQAALVFIRDMRAAAKEAAPAWDTDASWQRLAARKVARERRPALSPYVWSQRRIPTGRRLAVQVAAALLLVTGGAGLWTIVHRQGPLAVPGTSEQAGMREHRTGRGERTTIRLADGSRVILAAASRLRYAEPFGQNGRRDIQLEGEALFQVEHDARRPFLVHTSRGVTEDLGTTFSVQEYPGDTAVRVVVAEGRVELRGAAAGHGTRATRLTAGQLASLGSTGDAVVRAGVDVSRLLSWTEGRLVFEDTPVAEVLAQLSRWYDLDFVLADPTLGARTLSATFAGEAVRPTLQLLASTLNLRYEQAGRRVTLYRKHLPS